MLAVKNHLDIINNIRVKKLNEIMKDHQIPSIAKLCSMVEIQPAVISRMLSENKLSEKHARKIEEYFNLPLLWMDNETLDYKKIPVFLLNNFKGIHESNAIFYINETSFGENEFYIKNTEKFDNLPIDSYFKFTYINDVTRLKVDDICLIKDEVKTVFHIARFDGFSYRVNSNRPYNIGDASLIGRCSAIKV